MSDLLTRIEQNDQTITAREIFEHVVVNLLRQGKPSIREHRIGIRCAYRGDDDTKCSGGWVIPDSIYTRSMEDNSIANLIDDSRQEAERLRGHWLPSILWKHRTTIQHLQTAHDQTQTQMRFGATFEAEFLIAINEDRHTFMRLVLGDHYGDYEDDWHTYLQSLVDRAKEPAPA